jgi:formate dehydrogenase subunit gamma
MAAFYRIDGHSLAFPIVQFYPSINPLSLSAHGTALLMFEWIPSQMESESELERSTKEERRMTPHHEPWDPARGSDIIAEHSKREGATLVILHALQEAFGYVPEPAIPMVAAALNLSRAEVYGVFTFYHDFRHKPAGRHVLKLCRAEACQAAGGDALAARAEQKLGIALGNTTADERLTLEPIYCLGLCATAPSAMLDGRLIGRLDEARIDAIVAETQR